MHAATEVERARRSARGASHRQARQPGLVALLLAVIPRAAILLILVARPQGSSSNALQ
jgi:hypothetical protein